MEDRKDSAENGDDVPDKALYNVSTSVYTGSKSASRWRKIRNLSRANVAFRNAPFSRPSEIKTHQNPMWDGYTGIITLHSEWVQI